MKKIYALLAALCAALFLNLSGPGVASAVDSIAPPDENVYETPETPEGSLPPSGRPAITPTACGTSTSRGDNRVVHVFDAEGGTDDWNFSYKVWYDRCANVTIVRSVTVRYEVTGNGDNFCSRSAIDKVRLNAGDLDGWNVPKAEFACQNGDHADAKNIDAPNGVQIFCGNDNLIGEKATMVRGPIQPDANWNVPAVTIPRPTSC